MVAAAALCGRQGMDAVRVLVQQLSVDKEGAWFSRCTARQTENGEGAGCTVNARMDRGC